jgi:septum site-determining protein MinC
MAPSSSSSRPEDISEDLPLESPADASSPEPEAPEPEVAEAEVAEPEVAEAEVAEPEVAEPEVAEVEVAEPEVAEVSESAAETASEPEEGERVDETMEETVTLSRIEVPPLRYFSAAGRVYLRIGPDESPEGLRLSLITSTLPDGPIWLSFEERPPTPALVNAISAVLVESIDRAPAGVRSGMETLIAGSAAAMGLPVEVPPARPAEEPEQRKVMVVERTLRSGASVRFRGDVLVYGDVNAGAQIEADGNIIVLGALRGLAHAGHGGDESALIISFDLRPTQIRIGRRIAFPPAQPRSRSPLPEVARIRDGEIVLQDFRGRISL